MRTGRVALVCALVAAGSASAQSRSNTQTVTVIDNDPAPTVSFGSSGQMVTEGNSGTTSVSATVSLSVASGKTVSLPYTVSGSAQNPSDHDAANGTLTLTPGQVSTMITFAVVGDTTPEGSETIVLTLGTPTGGTATLGTPSSHTVTIDNDDIVPDTVTLTDRTVYAENYGFVATAGFRLGKDGRIYTGVNGSWTVVSNSEWLYPPIDVNADNYEFMYTVTSGSLAGPGTAVWHALTVDRELTRTDPPINWGAQIAVATVQIRRIGTTNTLATATITLQAFAEPSEP